MTTAERPPVAPGEPAPEFTLPAVDGQRTGVVGRLPRPERRIPPGCSSACGVRSAGARSRRWARTRPSSKALGVESLGIVATEPENARLYFKFRPTRLRLGRGPGAHDASPV